MFAVVRFHEYRQVFGLRARLGIDGLAFDTGLPGAARNKRGDRGKSRGAEAK